MPRDIPLHRLVPTMIMVNGTAYWTSTYSGLRWRMTPEDVKGLGWLGWKRTQLFRQMIDGYVAEV